QAATRLAYADCTRQDYAQAEGCDACSRHRSAARSSPIVEDTQMRTLAEFTKTTLIGGFLIVLPVYVSLLLLAKVVTGVLGMLKPITAGIPAAVELRQVVAILVLAAACFIAGLIVRTGPGLRAKNAFEGAILEKLPGYTLLRGIAGRLTGKADETTFAPALAEIEEALVPALIIEELEDGSFTVLVPSVP